MYHPNYSSRPSTAPATTFRNLKQSTEVVNAQQKIEIAENDHGAVSKLLNHKIDQNQFVIDKLTQENKEILNLLKASQSYATKLVKSDGQQKVVKLPTDTVLAASVKDNALQLDKLKADKLRVNQQLSKLNNTINLMQAEIDRPEPVVEKALKRVRELENDLDDASIKEKEAFSIQDTYKTIISKLQQEQLRFENEINFAQQQNLVCNRDIQQLVLYTKEAEDATQLTNAQFVNFQESIKQMQQARRQELLSRRHEAEQILEKEREAERARQQEAQNMLAESLKIETREQEAPKAWLGEQFLRQQLQRARDMSGIDNLEHLVRKCQNQAKNREELEVNCKENQEKLTSISKEVQDLRIQLQDIAFVADSMGNRRILDRLKHQIQEEHFRISTVQLHSQKADAQFNLVMRGAQHLCELLYIIAGTDPDAGLPEQYTTQRVEKLLQMASGKFAILKEHLVEARLVQSSQMRVSRAINCVDIDQDTDAVDMQGDWDGSGLVIQSSVAGQKPEQAGDAGEFGEIKDDADFQKLRKQQKDASRKIVASQKKEEW